MTAPITPRERAFFPDVLRGLAIGGILLVNLQNFAGYAWWEQAGVNRAAQVLIDLFANGKWITVFAMLFGAGVALSVARAGRARQTRRLGALLLIGVLHGVFVWSGDILSNYALVGFALLLFVYLGSAWLQLLVPAALALTAVQIAQYAREGAGAPVGASYAGVDFAYVAPRYGVVLAERADDYLGGVLPNATFFGPWLLGLFLIGVLVARSGALHEPKRFRRAFAWAAGVAFVASVPLDVAFAHLNQSGTYDGQSWALLLRLASGLSVAVLYASLVGLAVGSGRGAWLAPFANVGRLALSNYLLQSVVCTLVFYGYGLGFYGRVGAAACLAFGLALYAAQVVLSTVYLRYFRVGPAEWTLRFLTYGRGRPERP